MEQFELKLLDIASTMLANLDYVPGAKMMDDIDRKRLYYTPENLKKVYDELKVLFN